MPSHVLTREEERSTISAHFTSLLSSVLYKSLCERCMTTMETSHNIFWRLNKSIRVWSLFLVFMCIQGPVVMLGTRPRSSNSRLSPKQASVLSGCFSKYLRLCSLDILYGNTSLQTIYDTFFSIYTNYSKAYLSGKECCEFHCIITVTAITL